MSDWPASGAPFGTPANPLGAAGADGTAKTAVRTDATIPAFDGTNPAASAVGDAAATGSAAFAARRDHKHARESFATPTIALGSAAAAGAATTPIRSDSTIQAFDTTPPADVAAYPHIDTVGVANFAARRDHVHIDPRNYMVFDDFNRRLTASVPPAARTQGQDINWLVENVALTLTQDTTQGVPGCWKFSLGGNLNNTGAISNSDDTLATPSMYQMRPRSPFTLRQGVKIDFTTQRLHTRGGLGYYPGSSEYPLYFAGFIWWYVDQEYASQWATVTGGTITTHNYPVSSALRKDALYFEVNINNVSNVYYIDQLSVAYTGFHDYTFQINGSNIDIYIDGVFNQTVPGMAATDPHGAAFYRTRSTGSNNPGGTRISYIDYFGMQG